MKATLTCPECGHKQQGEIPKDSCVPFYECNSCNKMIKAKNYCCVFCEYSDKKCSVSHKIK